MAESVFNNYIESAGIEVWYESRLRNVVKDKSVIKTIELENAINPRTATRKVRAKVFLDCSYEGDLMAKAGVSYTVGREANALYNENYNGVQLLNRHQLPDNIDPYVIKGDPNSGLLYGVNGTTVESNGTDDKKVQAYNFRIALTNNPDNGVEITKPDNYDSARYALLVRLKALYPWKSHTDFYWI
ncbi:hypothetical protein EZS27_031323 [termite gut metagenome]|uniref:Uncharacterized protein n=1 Tax=termite gut metagenome TaxID=433724 RepID=A0A5J4QC58_9ZZZZ